MESDGKYTLSISVALSNHRQDKVVPLNTHKSKSCLLQNFVYNICV